MTTSGEIDATLGRFASFDDTQLARRWHFKDKPVDVRYVLYRTMEDAQEIVVAAAPRAESCRILAHAQRAYGDLRGLLVGLPDDLLDKTWGEKEWPLREILRHIIVIEGRYGVQTRYAVDRADADPMRVADDRMPTPAQTDVSGPVAQILARLGAARAASDEKLADLPAGAMTRPTQWMHYDVDVRFRLHRFAAHLIEHTVHCEKALDALGWRLTEGRRIVRRLTALIGEVEGVAGPDAARGIEKVLVERAASVG